MGLFFCLGIIFTAVLNIILGEFYSKERVVIAWEKIIFITLQI